MNIIITQPNPSTFLAIDPTSNHSIVGRLEVRRWSWCAVELGGLFVAPEYRNRGIATTLVSYALRHISSPVIVATIRIDNLPSRKVFEKNGFIPIKRFYNPATGNTILLYIYHK